MQTNRHINTMNRPGLRAGPIENIPSEGVSTIKLCELVLAILQLPVKPQTLKPP